jgi:DNA-binding sugar fermentation-stimulating protein
MKSFYTLNTPIIIGTFLRELKHRFLCIVIIGGEEVECYIPCSSHLEHFVDLVGRKVLLTINKKPNSRTQYSVLAVKYKKHNILLNTSLANKAMYHYFSYNKLGLYKNDCSIAVEKKICNYIADILVDYQDQIEIIEIKSIISIQAKASFPSVFSQRAIDQLKHFLIMPDYINIKYCLVSFSPYIDEIYLNKENKEYYELFVKCLDRGMKYKAYFCSLAGNKVKIIKELPVYI